MFFQNLKSFGSLQTADVFISEDLNGHKNCFTAFQIIEEQSSITVFDYYSRWLFLKVLLLKSEIIFTYLKTTLTTFIDSFYFLPQTRNKISTFDTDKE